MKCTACHLDIALTERELLSDLDAEEDQGHESLLMSRRANLAADGWRPWLASSVDSLCQLCARASGQEVPIRTGRYPVTSGALKSVGFDVEAGIMSLEFHSGALWSYFTPLGFYLDFVQAPSLGAFYARKIKGQFRAEKVEA